jgi:hypothetical protein
MNPQARSSDLIVQVIDEELLVFDRERQLAHSLNVTAARVWQACDGQRDLDALAAECEIDQSTLALALERLRDVHLLEQRTTTEPIHDAPATTGVSRRAMLRKSVLAGAGLGIAIPVIRSITAPSIAMAATSGRSGNQVCGKAGQHCTGGSQCSPSSTSFCNTAFDSCQRSIGRPCLNTSSCLHMTSKAFVCAGGTCGFCASNGQCPDSHPTCIDHVFCGSLG